MMMKRQTPGDSETSWKCSYCKELGHSGTRGRFYSHHSTRCPTCGNIGHKTKMCCSRFTRKNVAHDRQGHAGAGSVYGPRPGVSAKDTSVEAIRDSNQVTIITESTKRVVVAAAKRNAEGEALPKPWKHREEVSIPKLLNPISVPPRRTLTWTQSLRVPSVV